MLLPTPVADNSRGLPNGGNYQSLPNAALSLLPTPVAADGNGHASRGEPRYLSDIGTLLPTPVSSDASMPDLDNWERKRAEHAEKGVNLQNRLCVEAQRDFGPYTAAIARWEHATGTPAPPPTEPGRDGRARLSPAFVEWMMGLPPGWVTAVEGVSRSQQLKILGNGVVPQQAALALRVLDS